MGRKRSHKGDVVSSDDSFVNNSDYMTPESKPSGSGDEISLDPVVEGPHEVFEDATSRVASVKEPEVTQELTPTETPAAVTPKLEVVALDLDTKPSPGVRLLPTKLGTSGRSALEPRLVIDKLVLTNFKSYAGRQEIGPFNASFSAVVGPNGSGKSNVIDSMLFVFGFRATKMRQGKLSELIHNSVGGDKLDFCQVDIHFMHVVDEHGYGDDRVSSRVEGSDLIISRKAHRNNSSQYYINGKSSNYTEVTQYLKGQGIDLDHKRFLILQGEVESIAQMKPKAEKENDDGLLEYLEDIIGTTNYKLMIEENLAKVEELNEVCLEKENRFVLVENDKNQLEEKKTEALRFLEMEKRLVHKKSIQYQVSISTNGDILQKNEAIVKELNDKVESEKSKNKHLASELHALEKQRTALKKEVARIDDQLAAVSKKQKAVHKANVTLEEKLKNLASKTKKLEKSKQLLEQALLSSQAKLDNSNAATLQYRSELDEHVKNLEVEKTTLDEMRRKLTDKTADFTREIEALQQKLEPWNDKIKEKETAIQLAASSIEMLEAQKANHTKQLADARQRLINIKTEGKEKEAEFRQTEAKLEQVVDQINAGEEQCNHEKQLVENKLQALNAARAKTQDAVKALSSVKNKNQVLSSLTRLAQSGRINGFHGRLGDLGTIDDKYDVAISTACPALDSLVVDTVETAQACINYLRKNKVGRANFICLNKLRKFNLAPIQTPGNPATVKRLFDLITPQDPKFLPAFYSKMYNTLVASDLQEARSVAFSKSGRNKVVTLDGKVVDISGTMSGGGNRQMRGIMRLASSAQSGVQYTEEEVKHMSQDLAQQENKYQLMEVEFREKEAKLRQLKEVRPTLEFTISRLRLDIESLAAEKKEVSKVCKALIAEDEASNVAEELDRQIAAKRAEVDTLTEEKNSVKGQMADLEAQIKALEEKIMDAGGVELRLQNSKVDSLKQKIEIITERMSGDVMAIKKLENDIKRHTKIIAESEKELKSAEEELNGAKEVHQAKVGELGELNRQLEEVQSAKEEKLEAEETLKGEIGQMTEQMNELRSAEIEIENKLEKYTAVVAKYRARVEQDEANLAGLVVRDVTEYISWLEEEERAKYNAAVIDKLSDEELEEVDQESVNEEIAEIEKYMNTVKVDIEVLKEYGEKMHEFEARRSDLNGAVELRDEIKNYCEELKRKRLDEFMAGFNTISLSLKEMYQLITMGGNAELELVDSLDPFSEGILFSVMPPKKSWKNISNLSGGEKTLSSLALVFALHKYKPTPLYVMDEIDAALDFRNVSIVANYIKERTKNAQFVVISLRNNMFELAQQLVGIYKVNNMTRSVSLQNKNFIEQRSQKVT